MDNLRRLADAFITQGAAIIIATGSNAPAHAAKAATATIPIVFITGGEPVKAGLVASLNRPGANITGYSHISSALAGKRLELLNQLIPGAEPIGVLINQNYPDSDLQRQAVQESAAKISQQINIVEASTDAEIDIAFDNLRQQRAKALFVGNDPFFNSVRIRGQIVSLAARLMIPSIYFTREFVIAGGLMSYGGSYANAHRRVGVYAGLILKGAKPGELPILEPTEFELVINLKTAKGPPSPSHPLSSPAPTR